METEDGDVSGVQQGGIAIMQNTLRASQKALAVLGTLRLSTDFVVNAKLVAQNRDAALPSSYHDPAGASSAACCLRDVCGEQISSLPRNRTPFMRLWQRALAFSN